MVGGFVDVLARLRVGRIEQSELDSARAKILKVYDTPDAGAARLPSYTLNLLCGHRNLTPDEHRAELAAVTVGDLRDVARELHSTALIQVPGRDVEWAGFTSAPQWSTTSRALAGTTHRSPGNDDVALVIGPRSVTLRTPGGEITVRYEACAALQVFPDGARHLTGLDGFTVAVEPTLYDRLGPDRVAVIDAGVPATAVVRMPERDADSIPRPASSPGGGLKSRTRSVLRSLRIGR
ncbi:MULTISPECIES: hypothetical protein [unclassified Streptomyces]|uniref:hypothetical protein n=1 Tax=unclassified Streptomyces TaxID=2593676 RepID=UPI002DD9AD46|nr:hypothetical protein [Streptomyces sp. NBC_01761]WSC54178.1 hypothetical protein OG808_19000 [Streptomyces sp. NBC_01761]WSF85018.1 hypothetical protein OIE70_19100 [Streptomyces sp. NBC_01744]